MVSQKDLNFVRLSMPKALARQRSSLLPLFQALSALRRTRELPADDRSGSGSSESAEAAD
jgi:hypothetical protein